MTPPPSPAGPWAGGAVLLAAAAFLTLRWLKQKQALEEDEIRL